MGNKLTPKMNSKRKEIEKLFNHKVGKIRFLNQNKNCDGSVTECPTINRVLNGLIKYQTLQRLDNMDNNHQQPPIHIFTEYLLTEYTNYMDDIIHLHKKHEYDLEKIHDLLLQNDEYERCDINNCLITDRYCDINDGKNGNIEVYNENNMDPLHVFHYELQLQIMKYALHESLISVIERVNMPGEGNTIQIVYRILSQHCVIFQNTKDPKNIETDKC